MAASCPKCTAPLLRGEPVCSACGESTFADTPVYAVQVDIREGFGLPSVCACCCAPAEREGQAKVYLGNRTQATIPMSWCQACFRRERLSRWSGLSWMLACGLGLLVACGYVLCWELDLGRLGAVVAGLVSVVGFVGGKKISDKLRSRIPGHGDGCQGVLPEDAEYQVAADPANTRGTLWLFHQGFADAWLEANPEQADHERAYQEAERREPVGGSPWLHWPWAGEMSLLGRDGLERSRVELFRPHRT